MDGCLHNDICRAIAQLINWLKVAYYMYYMASHILNILPNTFRWLNGQSKAGWRQLPAPHMTMRVMRMRRQKTNSAWNCYKRFGPLSVNWWKAHVLSLGANTTYNPKLSRIKLGSGPPCFERQHLMKMLPLIYTVSVSNVTKNHV